tara:strand:- start:481 stop:1512 length:1032 start_codon:yes stop_codon:yes gene_type:complete
MVINGAMNVAQRATSVTGVGATAEHYPTLDRWIIEASTAGRLTMSQTADGPNGISANCIKLDCTTADTSIAAGEYLLLEQRLEGQNVQRIGKGVAGAKEVTVSFYVKANAAFDFALEVLDNTDGRTCSKLFSTTTDWVRQELTFPADVDDGSSPIADDNATSIRLFFWLHAGTTYTGGTLQSGSFANNVNANRAAGIDSFFSSTDNNFFITGVQMEVGPIATEFEQEDFGTTLVKCMRYYEKQSADNGQFIAIGYNESTSNGRGLVPFKVKKRTAPTMSDSGTHFAALSTGSTGNAADVTFDQPSVDNARWILTNTNTTLIDGGASLLRSLADGSFVQADAEL